MVEGSETFDELVKVGKLSPTADAAVLLAEDLEAGRAQVDGVSDACGGHVGPKKGTNDEMKESFFTSVENPLYLIQTEGLSSESVSYPLVSDTHCGENQSGQFLKER